MADLHECPACHAMASERQESRCPSCHKAAMDEIAARMAESFAGGESSPAADELRPVRGGVPIEKHQLPIALRDDARQRRYKHE